MSKVTIKFWSESREDYVVCDDHIRVDRNGLVTFIVEDILGRKHEVSQDSLVAHFFIKDKRIGIENETKE